MIYEINHIGVLVDDVETARTLYEGVLGGREVYRRTRPEGSRILYLQFGGSLVELIGGVTEPVGGGGLGLHHIGMLSDDLEGDLRLLLEAGATLLSEPRPGGPGTVATAFVADPHGIRIELLDRPFEFRRVPDAERSVDTVDHLSLRLPSPDAVLAFYRDAIGMEVLSSTQRDSGDEGTIHMGFEGRGRAVRLRPGGEDPATVPSDFENETLEIHWGASHEPGIDHIAFRVDDVDTAVSRLADAGHTPRYGDPRAAYSGVGSVAAYRDEGAEFEVLDRPLLRRFLGR
ncbi:MAG: VOC family protein [Cryobacterium sp.]|nr:VOC family protein [Cryobacterium sp.]